MALDHGSVEAREAVVAEAESLPLPKRTRLRLLVADADRLAAAR